jgi:hypothetical protein
MKNIYNMVVAASVGAGSLSMSEASMAGLGFPADSLVAMAAANPQNGDCTLTAPRVVQNQQGKSSVDVNISRPGTADVKLSIESTLPQTQWSESQGIRQNGQAYWRFILAGGDASKLGAVTSLIWDVEGSDLKTKSLSIAFVDGNSLLQTLDCM